RPAAADVQHAARRAAPGHDRALRRRRRDRPAGVVTGPEGDGAPAGAGRPRAHRVLGGAIAVVGVLAFSLLAWRKLLRGETDLWVVAAAVAVVLGGIALGFWVSV